MNNPRPSRVRRAVVASGAALVIAVSGLGFGAYSYLKPTTAASGPVEAVALADVAYAQAGDEADVYSIQSGDSTASFVIDEVLRGEPYTVVGTTDQVAGQFALDLDNVQTAQVGTILVSARSLTTDDESRTRALGNWILNTDEYEYIAFTPTTLSGLPSSATVGQAFTFEATGDLTIKDVTKPATFEIVITPAADGALVGSASTTINYADWGVEIPSVPFVAGVGEQVELQLDFTASA